MYDDYEESIQGADYMHTATVRCSAADPLVKAWLTWKINILDADPGVLQKAVTTSNVAGTGQITADGSATSGVATIRFDLTASNLTGLNPRDYLFDVKVKTSSGAEAFAALGIWHLWSPVTLATA